MLFLVLVIVAWLLRRLGLDGLLSISAIVAAFARRGPGPSSRQRAATLFRCRESATTRTSVRLVGHDSGVMLGDIVTARGVVFAGTLHAFSVFNHSTGAVLRRPGLSAALMWCAIDVFLCSLLLSHIVGR